MARRTQNPIRLDEITDAFVHLNLTLKMEDIKEYVFNLRGNSFYDYDSKYSFDQTIQAKVQSHTRGGYGFTEGKEIFQSAGTGGYYKLRNHEFYADKAINKADDIILKLTVGNYVEDLELTDRTLREVNSINRNKALVVGLKQLYDNQCQLCGIKLEIDNGNTYSEVHHIKPLGEPHNGPDTSSNMIVVCPNCHVLLDFKSISLRIDNLNLKTPHRIDEGYIDYHNHRRE